MSNVVYEWKRFWCPREGAYSLNDDGYLDDPEADWANFFGGQASSFDEISSSPCLVLLGEPGIGKTTAIRNAIAKAKGELDPSADIVISADLREYSSDERLTRKVFESSELQRWKTGTHNLHLFLDSMDEGLLHIANIVQVLESELRDLPLERMRFRIACRTAAWIPGFEDFLQSKWPNAVGVFELLPLRRRDVICAAAAHGLDTRHFIEEIRSRDVVSLAIKPVTLKFLIASFSRSQSLPSTRHELYLEGCMILCEEPRREDLCIGRSLTADQRLSIAAKLAAVTQLGNRNAIWLSHNGGNVPAEDVCADELLKAGVSSMSELREVLNTGLFTSRGAHRLGWAHQSYPEFLAAHFLETCQITHPSILKMIQHPDGSGRVVPQLREVAAWLAHNNGGVFRDLMKSDPEVLISSDLLGRDSREIAELTRSLLQSIEASGAQVERSLRLNYSRLDNVELLEILREYVIDASHHEVARVAAMQIAIECGVRHLQDDLLSVALEEAEPFEIRVWAAMGVRHIGDNCTKAKLKVFLEGAEQDVDDEMKGIALHANWPDNLKPEELLAVLRPPKNPRMMGTYSAFLQSDIPAAIKISGFPCALKWAAANSTLDPTHPLGKLADAILLVSADHLEDDEVCNELAHALCIRSSRYISSESIGERLKDRTPDRRKLAKRALSLLGDRQSDKVVLLDAGIITKADVEWLLQEFETAEVETGKELLAFLIHRVLRPDDIEAVSAVTAVSRSHPILARELMPIIAPIDIRSIQAEQERTYYQRRVLASQEEKPVRKSLESLFAQADQLVLPSLWWHLSESGKNPDPRIVHDYSDLQERILDLAHAFVIDGPSARAKADLGYVYAGLWAFGLLREWRSSVFLSLSNSVWVLWACTILEFANTPPRKVLLKHAHTRAEEAIVAALGQLIEVQNEKRGAAYVVDHIDGIWGIGIAGLLLAKLGEGNLKPESFRQILAQLLKHGEDRAWNLAYQHLEQAVPQEAAGRTFVVEIATELVLHDDAKMWPWLLSKIQTDGRLALEVMQGISYRCNFGNERFPRKLTDDQICDLFLWLEPEASKGDTVDSDESETEAKLVTPARALRYFTPTLLMYISKRGTKSACNALRRLIRERPTLPGLTWYLKNAEEQARRTSWVPLQPNEVVEIAGRPSLRIIRNADDLAEVVLEALYHLEDELQGVQPTAEFLWNVPSKKGQADLKAYTPKDESALSNYVKKHLERELTGRGVISNREVEIRAPLGGAPGEKPDVMVDALIPSVVKNEQQRVSVAVEVKGCWHKEVTSAMETQLAGRYLKGNELRHGIYVVGWYKCSQWDEGDYRLKAVPWESIEDARLALQAQATALSVNGLSVKGIVLNAALR